MQQQTSPALSLNNVYQPEYIADPYPLYQRLRETDPVFWDETLNAWVLTSYADAVVMLRDPRFSAVRFVTDTNQIPPEVVEALGSPMRALTRQMLFLDPPDHTRLRGLVAKAFASRRDEGQGSDQPRVRIVAVRRSFVRAARIPFDVRARRSEGRYARFCRQATAGVQEPLADTTVSKTVRTTLLLFAGLLLAGCASTSLQSAWYDTSYNGGAFRKILVVGVGANLTDRRVFEDIFAQQLNATGTQGIPGYQFLPDNARANEPGWNEGIAKSGADGLPGSRVGRRHEDAGDDDDGSRPNLFRTLRQALGTADDRSARGDAV